MMDLDLIDVISEQHVKLRKKLGQMWSEASELSISQSEWFIMARIYRKQPTVAQVARQADITRQAVHKLIKSLEAKGLVETTKSMNNKDKCLRLTPLGEQCCEQLAALKAKLEQAVAEQIGQAEVERLKLILSRDWGM